MKSRIWFVSVLSLLVVGSVASLAQESTPSLGDYARSVRKSKAAPAAQSKPPVYDNDNMPRTTAISVVGAPSASTDTAKNEGTKPQEAKDANTTPTESAKDGKLAEGKQKKDEPEIKPGQSVEERKKAIDGWKSKLDAQKERVNLLARELDLLQREYNVKASEFYANTALRAQNPSAFADTDAKYKQQIADKQQALDAAKTKLSDMQDQGRSAGVPDSASE